MRADAEARAPGRGRGRCRRRSGLSIERLFLPWGLVDLGPLALPITVIWIVGVINAVNLIDGLDGLASGVVLTVLGAFGLLAAVDGLDPMLPLIAATVGAAVGFLAYNLHPASIIMGDAGSMFLGFVVAAIGDLADPGRGPAGGRHGCRSSRWASRSSTRPGPSCAGRRGARRSSSPIAATSTTSSCGWPLPA